MQAPKRWVDGALATLPLGEEEPGGTSYAAAEMRRGERVGEG